MAGLSRGWGKSITVIIMTMEANSTATSAILKPSAAPAYQGAPWNQQEATRAPRLRRRFAHIQYTLTQTDTHKRIQDTLIFCLERLSSAWTNTSAKKFAGQHISLRDTLCGQTLIYINVMFSVTWTRYLSEPVTPYTSLSVPPGLISNHFPLLIYLHQLVAPSSSAMVWWHDMMRSQYFAP